jgi:hypothetical protein
MGALDRGAHESLSRPRPSMVEALRALGRRGLALWQTPLGKVLAAALLLRLAGLTWGLPSTDGWDDDGVAPRDFLVGVLETYSPGHHYTYPPLHLLLLTLVSAPIWLAALLRAPVLEPAAVVHAFLRVPTMTAMAVMARAVAALLSLGLLWNVAEIARLLRGSRRAGAWAAVACGVNAVLTYYSQTTNLDLPYLFWSVLSLRWLVCAVVHRAPSALRRVLIFAALAVATKDQAYALFLLGIPMSLAAWLLIDREARPLMPSLLRQLGLGLLVAVPLLLVIDGALTNPAGWRDRVHYLLGSASQDFAYYPQTWVGRLRAAGDGLLSFGEFYPWPFAALAALGMVVACRESDRARRAAGLVPLFAAISFTLSFDMSARRSELRFVLPQMVMLGVYVGLALDEAHERLWPRPRVGANAGASGGVTGGARPSAWRWALLLGVAVSVACALFKCVSVDAAMLLDPRYDAERWMSAHVQAGDRMEIYGSNVQLPRLPAVAKIERVDVSPADGRNPIPGVTEVTARFSEIEARQPRFIVVPEQWVGRYLVDPHWGEDSGRALSPGQQRIEGDLDSRGYFHALREGLLRYRVAHVSRWDSRFWPQVDIHASLTRSLSIFERAP